MKSVYCVVIVNRCYRGVQITGAIERSDIPFEGEESSEGASADERDREARDDLVGQFTPFTRRRPFLDFFW